MAGAVTPIPRRSERRRLFDLWLSRAMVPLMVLMVLLCFGPIEIAWLFIGGRLNHAVSSTGVGLVVAILGMLMTLVVVVGLLRRLEGAWVLVRRAAGLRQQRGILEFVFVIAVGLTTVVFAVWFLGFSGASPIPVNVSY